METKQIVVMLMVLAIVFSLLTVVFTMSIDVDADFVPANNDNDTHGTASGGVVIDILPNNGGGSS